MSEQTERVGFDWPDDQDVEALAAVLSLWGTRAAREGARAVLASDWLAERDERMRRRGDAA